MRLIFAFFLLFGFAFGIDKPRLADFVACYENNKASILIYEGMQAFALSENLLAVIKKPNAKLNKYLKYDPYLNLYLVRTDFSLFPPKMLDEQELSRADWLGILDAKQEHIGHIKFLAQNLDEKDQIDFKGKTGLLSTPCSGIAGIALGNFSFIGNRYLKHFMKYNEVYWGDIGADFIIREDKIYVDKIRQNSQFLLGDEILSIDNIKINDLRVLNEKILFSERGATLHFKILRDNDELDISSEVFAKITKETKTNTPKPKSKVNADFRSNFGLSINSNLIITKIEPNSKASAAGFALGDKIIRLNNEEIKNLQSLQSAINSTKSLNFLIERDTKNLPVKSNGIRTRTSADDGKFQFFVRLEK